MQALSAERGVVVQLPLFAPRPAAAARHHDVHAISLPARAFTGDFYFTHRSDDRLWFGLGDVAGKGLPAAVFMAMIQEELEQLTGCEPARSMMRLHTFLRPLIPRNRFATAVIGNLSSDGTLVVANAGHCPPLIARAGGAIERIASTGPVLGILAGSAWQSWSTTLERGDALILYSDGLLEARSIERGEFGIERIQAAIRGDSARTIAESIVSAQQQHAAAEDDLTLLVIRRTE